MTLSLERNEDPEIGDDDIMYELRITKDEELSEMFMEEYQYNANKETAKALCNKIRNNQTWMQILFPNGKKRFKSREKFGLLLV